MDALLETLLNSTTVARLTDFLEEIEEEHSVAWRPVGRDNNLAIINLGSDPGAGLIERVTNAIDAVLDRKWAEQGEPAHLTNPRHAVEDWCGIKEGRLVSVATSELPKYKDVTGRVTVTLRDSDRRDSPTVDIRDLGTGLLSQEMAGTILSLNESIKLRKLFLAGAFGQGGSTALAYSKFTVIVTRAAGEDGTLADVAATVVRFNPGNPKTDKHGQYQYMVNHHTGQPFSFSADSAEFEQGTLVRHIMMELSKYSAPMTTQRKSLWFLAQNYLFDPVLPFTIEEARSHADNARRTVTGNHRLLTHSDKTEYQRNARFTFGDGEVRIAWWVLSAEGDNPRDRITQYVLPSKPFVVTFNGQKQGDFPNTIIKNDLKLPYLERYLVVHIDCDSLDAESRRQLFPTTREALRDTAIGEELKGLVIDTLSGDERLKELDRDRKRRYISQTDTEAVESIRRRLVKRVKVYTNVAGKGKGPRPLPPDEPNEPSDERSPIPVQDPPTFIRITSQNPRQVYAGRRFTLKFETDARPDYFSSVHNFLAVIDPPSFANFTGTASLHQGHGVAYFTASENVEVGDTADITLEVRPPRGKALSDDCTAKVVPFPDAAGTGDGSGQTPNINPQWVSEGDNFWVERGWDRTSVASVVQESDSVDIFVSVDNQRLNSLITRAQRKDETAVDRIKDFYLEHIAYHAMIVALDAERVEDDEQLDSETSEKEQNDELRRACDTITGIMTSLFDVLVDEPVTSEAMGNAD